MDMNAPFVRFHDPDKENGYMSNWYMSPFTLDGKTYNCAEQYIMEQKALLFGDTDTAKKIMLTDDPQEMRDLGRKVYPYIPNVWNGTRQLVLYRALKAKFLQNPQLLGQLLATGDRLPVECAKSDTVWAVGLRTNDPDVDEPEHWNGQNILGFTLQAVREDIKRICAHADSIISR